MNISSYVSCWFDPEPGNLLPFGHKTNKQVHISLEATTVAAYSVMSRVTLQSGRNPNMFSCDWTLADVDRQRTHVLWNTSYAHSFFLFLLPFLALCAHRRRLRFFYNATSPRGSHTVDRPADSGGRKVATVWRRNPWSDLYENLHRYGRNHLHKFWWRFDWLSRLSET